MSVFEPFDSFSDIDDILFKLEDEDPGICQVGVMELAETASDDAVPHIIVALSDLSDDVRLQAARVLQEFDGETSPRDCRMHCKICPTRRLRQQTVWPN